MTGDWMALVFERLQSASRSVRLTLPPTHHERFWARFLELAQVKQSGLAITLLLPQWPEPIEPITALLKILPDLELTSHELSWSAAKPLPYSLCVVDDLSALFVAGNPDAQDGTGYWRFTEDTDETRGLRDAFDRRAASGTWGLDPTSWMEWLEQVAHRKVTRTALGSLHRGERKLAGATARALKTLPKRGFWLIKPRDSAYGLAEPPGILHWGQWVHHSHLAIGWPELADAFYRRGKLPKRADFVKWMIEHYPGFRDRDRAYATARAFIEQMRTGDRIAAVDGWTAKQASPVRFHGWGRIHGEPELEQDGARWPLTRPAHWQRFEVELPVEAVRAVTQLDSCTYPIHRIDGPQFSRLTELADDVRRTTADSQITLDLSFMGRINGQQDLL
ncbi:hypothetical protein KQI63_09525 [bacterium]|nr:hypothetical protein [bacterium]